MDGLYTFLNENALYIVLLIALLVWAGIFAYLYRLDKKIRQIERSLKRREEK
ncbi:MAG TPA: CcmD family protein [Bacteroidota bacterium]